MSDRYDEHLSFDLPYGYEAVTGVNDDGERTFCVLCGTSLNDEGETTSEPKPAPEPEEKARREEEARRKAEEETKREKAWQAWLDECEAVKRRRADALASLQQKRRIELRQAAQAERDKALKALTAEREQAAADREAAEKTLASLGFLKFAEKKQQKALIERLTNETLPALKKREEEIGAAYASAIASIEDKLRGEEAALSAEAERAHPLPEQPEKPESVLEKERAEAAAREARYGRLTDRQRRNERLKIAIWQYLYDHGEATVSEMLEDVPELEDESNQSVSALCRALFLAGSIRKETRRRLTYFSASEPPDESPDDLPDALPDAPSREPESPSSTSERSQSLKAEILKGLASEGPMTVSEMLERIPALKGESNQYISALCRALVLSGEAEKYAEMRSTYFRIP